MMMMINTKAINDCADCKSDMTHDWSYSCKNNMTITITTTTTTTIFIAKVLILFWVGQKTADITKHSVILNITYMNFSDMNLSYWAAVAIPGGPKK